MYPLKQSTAITVPFFAHDVNGDGVTEIAAGSWTKRISKNGGAFGAMTVTITEMENGWYSLPIGTDHSDTIGVLTVSLSAAAAKRVNLQFRVHARVLDDLAFPNVSGRGMDVDATGGVEITVDQNVNVNKWLTATPDALSSGKIPADLKLWLAAAPVALTTSGFVQVMLLRWLTDNAAGTLDALSSGKVAGDVKLWLAVAPNALVAGRVDADLHAIEGNTGGTPRLDRASRTEVLGTAGAAATTTSIPTSSLDPAAVAVDQFKGRIVIFDKDTATTALRGQASDITANTAGGTLTVTALTTAPVSGDTFVIV